MCVRHCTKENFPASEPLAKTVFSSIFQNMQSSRNYIQPFFMIQYNSEIFRSKMGSKLEK